MRVELAMVSVTLLVSAAAGVLVLREGAALGWDESVYAIASRNYLEPHPSIGLVQPYRPPGLPVIATVTALTGFADPALRLVSLVLGLLALASAWLLGRLVFGARAAVLGLVASVAATSVSDALPVFQNDLASTGAMLLLMALLWHELQVRATPGKALLLAAPLAAGGFYLRYGIVAAVFGIAVAACIVWWRQMLAHKRLIGATVALTLLLVAPHLAWATIEIGRPWGILVSAMDAARTSSPLETLVTFATWLPTRVAGPLTFVFVIAGMLLVAIIGVRRLRGLPSDGLGRPVVWLALPGLIAAAGTVTVSHAEPRYVLFTTMLWTLLGAEALGRAFDLLTARSPSIRRHGRAPAAIAGVALGAAATVMLGVQVWRAVSGEPDGRWYEDPARAIAVAADRPCVVATTLPPMVGWYSGCRAISMSKTNPDLLLAVPAASHWVVVTSGDVNRTSEKRRTSFQALLRDPPIAQREQGPSFGRAYRVHP